MLFCQTRGGCGKFRDFSNPDWMFWNELNGRIKRDCNLTLSEHPTESRTFDFPPWVKYPS